MTKTMTNFLNEYNNATDKKEVVIKYNAKFVLNVFKANTTEELIEAKADIQTFNDEYLNKYID